MPARVAVMLRSTEYRGDHTAEIATAHEVLPGETVEALAARLLVPACLCPEVDAAQRSRGLTPAECDHSRGDVVELRLVRAGR